MEKSIETLYKEACRDPTLAANLNLSEILANNDRDYLIDQTIDTIHQTTYDTLVEHGTPSKLIKTLCQKLANYRFVDDLCDLHLGKHIRWIKLPITEQSSLTNGGIATEIKFLEGGSYVVCKNNYNQFMQYKLDNALTFQILTEEEQCILLLNNEL
jgi:hypothetical protein